MTTRRRCKVERARGKYDLDSVVRTHETLDEYLLARWNGTDDRPAEGYRSLTEWFNRRLAKRVYDEAGRETVGTRLESEYEALVGDDDLLRSEVADDLRADGISVDELLDDVISWSTMRHHLKDCLDGEKARPSSTTDWERTSVDIAREQVQQKARSALGSLDSKDVLPGGSDADVLVGVQLQCPTCHVTVPFDEAIDRGYVCEHVSPTGGTPTDEASGDGTDDDPLGSEDATSGDTAFGSDGADRTSNDGTGRT